MCKHVLKQLPTLIKYFTFNPSVIGSNNVFKEYERVRNMLIHDYWEDEMTGIELGNKYNYPSPCIITGKLFKHLNIPTRTCKDTNLLLMLNGKHGPTSEHTNYVSGWHTTWNNKEVYLRSSYEFDYAKELDNNKIEYEVESLRIKYWNSIHDEYRCAIPDFYLPKSNTITEIKSNWTLNKQEMRDKIKAYHELGYNVRLICDHKDMDIKLL